MPDCVAEQDQVHGQHIGLQVVVLQLLLQRLLQAVQVGGLLVRRHAIANGLGQEVAVHRPLQRILQAIHHRRVAGVEVRRQALVQQAAELGKVVGRREPIAEHAHALVHPQAQHALPAVEEVAVGLQHALHHLADVAKVEQVVALLRRRQEVGSDGVEQRHGARDDGGGERLDFVLELRQLGCQDALEDAAHLGLDGEREVEDVEPGLQALTDDAAATTGRAHRSHQLHVQNVAPRLLLPVVPATVVHPLPQQLQRRLAAEQVLLWHVQVVDEGHQLAASGRAQLVLRTPLQHALQDLLRDQRRRGRREVQRLCLVLVAGQQVELLLHQHRLARARVAHHQHVAPLVHERRQHVRVAHRVHRRHDDRRQVAADVTRRAPVAVHAVLPQLEVLGLGVHKVLVHGLHGWVLRLHISDALVDLLPPRLRRCGAHAPRQAERKPLLAHGEEGLRVGSAVDAVGGREQRLQQVGQRLDGVELGDGDELLHLLALHDAKLAEVLLEQRQEPLPLVRGLELALHPRLDERLPAEVVDVQVHHAGTRHRGRRRHGKVLHLEQQRHGAAHADAVAVDQRQRLVVVHDGVHGLDPQRVHGAVQDEPLLVGLVVLAEVAEHGRQDAVRPLHRLQVVRAVQLVHVDALRVDHLRPHEREAVHAGLGEAGARASKHRPACALAAEAHAHQHVAMAGGLGVAQLDALLDDDGVVLEAGAGQLLGDDVAQLAELVRRQVQGREQVRQQQLEQRGVGLDELGDVHVPDGAQHDELLIDVGVLALACAGTHQHTAQRPQAVVIVVLLGQLLHHEAVQGDGLLGEDAGALEALRLKHDLGDEGQVRHHHSHGAEQRLQVVGELRTPGVAGVHGDEDTAVPVATDLGLHEHEPRLAGLDGGHDGQDLLRHHAQHLDLDTVELIEAAPATGLDEA